MQGGILITGMSRIKARDEIESSEIRSMEKRIVKLSWTRADQMLMDSLIQGFVKANS